jgi:hypothetical protein
MAYFVCGHVEKVNSIKVGVGERDKVAEKHILRGVFTLPGAVLIAWVEAKDKDV